MRVYKIFTDAGPVNEWFSGDYIGSLNSWDKDESEAKLFISLDTAEKYLHAGRHRDGSYHWVYAEIVAYELVRVED